MQNHHVLGSFQRICGPPEEHSQLFFNEDSTPVYQIWSVKNTPDTTRLNCHGTTQPGPPHLTEQSAEHPTPGSLSLQPGTDITFPPPPQAPAIYRQLYLQSIYRCLLTKSTGVLLPRLYCGTHHYYGAAFHHSGSPPIAPRRHSLAGAPSFLQHDGIARLIQVMHN